MAEVGTSIALKLSAISYQLSAASYQLDRASPLRQPSGEGDEQDRAHQRDDGVDEVELGYRRACEDHEQPSSDDGADHRYDDVFNDTVAVGDQPGYQPNGEAYQGPGEHAHFVAFSSPRAMGFGITTPTRMPSRRDEA